MDGLDVVIGCETCEMYIYGVDGLDVVIGVRRARCMYDVCIYGVDGLDVVIGCETCEMYVYMEWMD